MYIADYSARIISYGGSSQVAGQGALSYNALSHAFYGSVNIAGKTVATTDQLPTMSLYATLANPDFSGTPTILSHPILFQNTSVLPAYYSLGRYIELDVMTANSKSGFSFL